MSLEYPAFREGALNKRERRILPLTPALSLREREQIIAWSDVRLMFAPQVGEAGGLPRDDDGGLVADGGWRIADSRRWSP